MLGSYHALVAVRNISGLWPVTVSRTRWCHLQMPLAAPDFSLTGPEALISRRLDPRRLSPSQLAESLSALVATGHGHSGSTGPSLSQTGPRRAGPGRQISRRERRLNTT